MIENHRSTKTRCPRLLEAPQTPRVGFGTCHPIRPRRSQYLFVGQTGRRPVADSARQQTGFPHGDVTDTALLREVQWDSFGSECVHLDFARVSQTELVEVSLPIHLHGEAPGAVGTGQLRFVTHEITIRCPAAKLPDHLTVDISHLQMGQSIHVNEMKLPEGASAVTPGSVVVVQVVAPTAETEEAAAGATEPELIRKKNLRKGMPKPRARRLAIL